MFTLLKSTALTANPYGVILNAITIKKNTNNAPLIKTFYTGWKINIQFSCNTLAASLIQSIASFIDLQLIITINNYISKAAKHTYHTTWKNCTVVKSPVHVDEVSTGHPN